MRWLFFISTLNYKTHRLVGFVKMRKRVEAF